MPKSSRLRWGLLGTARINRAVIEPIKHSKLSNLVAVASRSFDRAAEYAKTWEIPRFHASYDDLLADPDIDVIYNSLPNSMHAEWTIKALHLGKHVLCEKPLTTSVQDMDKLSKVAHETGLVVAEGFMFRHHPQTIFVKQMVENGDLGRIQLIYGSFCYTNTRSGDPRFNPELGGGSLWDVGCYPINYARYLLDAEPLSVYGHQVTNPAGVDILFGGQMLFPDDTITLFESSFITPFKVHMEITGDKGRVVIPEPYKPGMKTILLVESSGQKQTIHFKGEKLYKGEIRDIEEAILDGKPPRISLLDSRENIATIEALYQSARDEIPIKLSNKRSE